MKQLIYSFFQSERRFKLLLAIVVLVIMTSLILFQAVILPRLSEKFYGRIIEYNHYGNSSTLIVLSQHMNYLFSLHSEFLTEVRIENNSVESIQDYLSKLKSLPGAKNVYCLLNGKDFITNDGVKSNEAMVDSLRDMRNLFKSYHRGWTGHPKKFHNWIMNKIRFVNFYDGADTLRLIISALDSTGNRFQVVPKSDFDPSMIKYLIITEIDEKWLRKEVPLHMEREFWDNEIFSMWSMADPSKSKEENGAGVLAFGDTLWWVGIKSIETEDEAKGASCEWEIAGHPWFHYRTLTELADDDELLLQAGWQFRMYKANFWIIYAFTVLITIFLLSLLTLIRKQWLRNQIALSHLAHSIKTPVARLQLAANIIEEGQVSSQDEEQKVIQTVSSECSHLRRAVENAALSIEGGKITVNKAQGDLAAVIREIVTTWQPLFDQNGIRLATEGLDNAVQCTFDVDKMRLLLDNMIDNALRHSYLDLKDNPDKPGLVTVNLSKSENQVSLSVTDSGAGLSGNMRKNLFKPMLRRDQDPLTGVSGLGLGLALVKEITEAHSGKVSVKDAPTGGARFVVTIPI